MKKRLLILLCILAFNIAMFAQIPWVQKASMNDPGRYVASCFSINGKGYVGLGQNVSGTKLYDFWEYDPTTNTWTSKGNYQGAGSYAATAFTINGKGYICLGADNSFVCHNDLWEYTPSTNSWLQKSSFPGTARYGASCFVLGDTAFIGTGSPGGPSYLTDMWMYVTSTDTWTQLQDFPGGARNHGTAFSFMNNGYLGTGLNDSGSATNDIWKYNRATNTWTNITNLPGPARMGVLSAVYQNRIYFGTGNDLSNRYNDFYEYFPATNTWSASISSVSAFTVRYAGICFSANNLIYVGTGSSISSTAGYLPDLWSFDPTYHDGINDLNISIKFDLNVYPNPTNDQITINFPDYTAKSNSQYSIYSIDGKMLTGQPITAISTDVSILDYPAGVYFIKVTNNTSVVVEKIVKE